MFAKALEKSFAKLASICIRNFMFMKEVINIILLAAVYFVNEL